MSKLIMNPNYLIEMYDAQLAELAKESGDSARETAEIAIHRICILGDEISAAKSDYYHASNKIGNTWFIKVCGFLLKYVGLWVFGTSVILTLIGLFMSLLRDDIQFADILEPMSQYLLLPSFLLGTFPTIAYVSVNYWAKVRPVFKRIDTFVEVLPGDDYGEKEKLSLVLTGEVDAILPNQMFDRLIQQVIKEAVKDH